MKRAATVDIILDFEAGKLNAGVTGQLPDVARARNWHAQILDTDAYKVISDAVVRWSDGATIYRTRGFYKGNGAPGFVVRLLGSPDLGKLLYNEDELRVIGRCVAHRLMKDLDQWDVWVLFTGSDGKRELWLASEDDSGKVKLYAACSRARNALRARAAA